MVPDSLNALFEATEQLSKTNALVVSSLPALESSEGAPLGLNLDAPVPKAFGSINECNGRIRALVGLTSGIAKMKPSDFELVPKTLLTALPITLNEINNQLGGMLQRIEQVKSDGGLRDVTDEFIIHSVNQQAHPNADLRGYYQNADNQVDQGLKGAQDILSIVNSKNYDAFSGALSGIKMLEDQLQKSRGDITSLLRDARSKATKIGTQSNDATSHLKAIQEKVSETEEAVTGFKETAAAHASEAEQSKSKITSLLVDVTEIEQQANALKARVDGLQPTLEDFQKKLDDRNSVFQQGKQEFDELREDMLQASKKNNIYIQQSKEALGWNTAKGLAHSFAQSAKELERPLLFSRVGFYFSIVFLLVSAAVAFNGVPFVREFVQVPKIPVPNNGIEAAHVTSLLAVLSIKIAIVLPAALLVGFTSRRHRALFHQHQLYTYKKTVASALPGFKDHAATHKEAMAAAAFARLLFNPQEDASRDLTREAGGPGWLGRWLESAIRRGMKAAMSSSDKGASV